MNVRLAVLFAATVIVASFHLFGLLDELIAALLYALAIAIVSAGSRGWPMRLVAALVVWDAWSLVELIDQPDPQIADTLVLAALRGAGLLVVAYVAAQGLKVRDALRGAMPPVRAAGRGSRALRVARLALLVPFVAIIPISAWGAYESPLTTSYVRRVPERDGTLVRAYELVREAMFFRSVADRVTAGLSDDESKITALMHWTNENVRPQYAAPDRVVTDSAYRIVLRGYGFCDQSAGVLETLAYFAGFDARVRYLVWPDGISYHSLAEVRLGARQILVDPWVGTIYRRVDGRPLGIDDLRGLPADAVVYQDTAIDLRAGYFAASVTHDGYPYFDPVAAVARKIGAVAGAAGAVVGPKVVSARTAPPSASRTYAPTASLEETPWASEPLTPTLTSQVEQYAQARLDQVEGRYEPAADEYADLLTQPLDSDMADGARFYLGLSLLRSGSPSDAVAAFTRALDESPESPWNPSILQYRGEARIAIGDEVGGQDDLRASDTPSARSVLSASIQCTPERDGPSQGSQYARAC